MSVWPKEGSSTFRCDLISVSAAQSGAQMGKMEASNVPAGAAGFSRRWAPPNMLRQSSTLWRPAAVQLVAGRLACNERLMPAKIDRLYVEREVIQRPLLR